MKFEFDTATDGAKEATALVTALTVLHGSAITNALETALGALEDAPVAGTDLQDLVRSSAALAGVEIPEEPSAADAFGAESPAPTPSVAAAPVAVDRDGIPWDERIHSSSKGTNKDGTWSRRRNTPDALFDSVMAELKGAAPNPPAPTTQAPPPPPPPSTAAAPATEVPPPPTTSTATPGSSISFPLLMVKITKNQSAGRIDKATVDSFLGAFDMTDVKDLGKASPDVVNAINEMVDAHING